MSLRIGDVGRCSAKKEEKGIGRSVKKLNHRCDTKPFFTVKTDFVDMLGLLILRNLLKTRVVPEESGLYGSPASFP
jgi:hypothetical protein